MQITFGIVCVEFSVYWNLNMWCGYIQRIRMLNKKERMNILKLKEYSTISFNGWKSEAIKNGEKKCMRITKKTFTSS